MARQPNFLLLFSDQQRWDALGVQQPWLATPHLDRLAGEGTLFERAYAPTPVCLPSRASTLTGQLSSTHGAANNFCYLPESWSPLLPALLAAAGYRTHIIGKSHLNAIYDSASPESLPFIADRQRFSQWHGPWYGFERADLCVGHTTEPVAPHMHYGVWLDERGVDVDRYFGSTPYDGAGAWDLPAEHHVSSWVSEVTTRALEAHAEAGEPFFLWVNFPDPHNPWFAPEPWASMYLGDDVPLPIPHVDAEELRHLDDKPAFYRDLHEQRGPYACRPSDPALANASNVSSLDMDDERLRRTIATYYGMTSMVDHHVGVILDRLDALGLAEDTVVVFTSDHGELLGDHGLWWKGLVAYEETMRVPFIVRAPGRVPAGARSTALQSHVDLAPTFCDLASVEPHADFDGVSQADTWQGRADGARRCVVVEERPAGPAWEQRILITERHKLVTYAGTGEGELYDLHDDPGQVRNRWNDPSARALRDELRLELDRQPHGVTPPRISPTLDEGIRRYFLGE